MDAPTGSVPQVSSNGRSSDAQRSTAPTHYILICSSAVFVKTAEFFLVQGGLEQDWGGDWRPVTVAGGGRDGIEAARAFGESVRGGGPRPPRVVDLKRSGVDLAYPGTSEQGPQLAFGRALVELIDAAELLAGEFIHSDDPDAGLAALCQRCSRGGTPIPHAETCEIGRVFRAVATVNAMRRRGGLAPGQPVDITPGAFVPVEWDRGWDATGVSLRNTPKCGALDGSESAKCTLPAAHAGDHVDRVVGVSFGRDDLASTCEAAPRSEPN